MSSRTWTQKCVHKELEAEIAVTVKNIRLRNIILWPQLKGMKRDEKWLVVPPAPEILATKIM